MEFPPNEDSLQAKIAEQLERLGDMFRRCAQPVPRSIEWRSSPHFPNELIAAQARAADLVIIGRDPLHGDAFHTFDPGAIILACGRPVLVLPGGINRLHASRVLIAWKDTREARRAVSDALPLLKEAETVTIAAVGPQDIEVRMREQIDDVAKFLQRHGATIGAKVSTSAREADAHVLLALADEQKARFDRRRRLWTQPVERMDIRRRDSHTPHRQQGPHAVRKLTRARDALRLRPSARARFAKSSIDPQPCKDGELDRIHREREY